MTAEELDRLGSVAWDAVPVLITPDDGWDWHDPRIAAIWDPGPPSWDELKEYHPEVADSYRMLAKAVADAVERDLDDRYRILVEANERAMLARSV